MRSQVRRFGVPLAAVAAVVAAVAALGLRLWTSSPLWLDEAQGVAIAALPLSDLFEALRDDGAPPLYYLLLHGWMAVFGTGDMAARSLSILFGLVALPLLWFTAGRWGGGRAASVAAVAVGASLPWMVRYASEARMYSLVVVLVLAATLAMDAVLRTGSRRAVAGLAVSTGALLLTHYWALFLYIVVGLALVAAVVVHQRGGGKTCGRYALPALSGLALGALLFLPWLPSFLVQIRTTGAPWAQKAYLSRLASLPGDWAGAANPGGRWLLLIVLPLLVLGVLALPRFRSWRGKDDGGRHILLGRGVGLLLAALTATTLVLATVAARVTSSGVEPRYTAVVLPFVVLLLARGIVALPRQVAAATLVAVVGVGLFASWDHVSVRRTQAADVSKALNRYAGPGDVVIYCPDQLAPSVHRQLDARTARATQALTVPDGSPSRIDWVDYEDRIDATSGPEIAARALERAGGGGAVWLMSSDRYLTHPSICGDIGGALRASRMVGRAVVAPDISAFEHGLLERFSPRSPWDEALRALGAMAAPLPPEI